MKKIIFSIIIIFTAITGICFAQNKFYLQTPAGVNKILIELNKRFPNFEDRLRAIALMRVGTPYVGGCLGEGPGNIPDEEPVFKTDVVDCTVFILTNSALAHAKNYKQAEEMMKKLNYYNPPIIGDKVVSYENRLHFTEERLSVCPYYKDITKELLPAVNISKITLTLNKKSDGSKLLNIPWEKKVTISYIPSSQINAKLLKKLPKVCGVAFVREKNSKIGIFVSHEGMIIDNKWLIHADSIAKEVKKVDFMKYYFEDAPPYFDGVIIYKFL